MRPGHTVEVEIRVLVDGRNRRFLRPTFNDSTGTRLLAFDDSAGGWSSLVATVLWIILRQTASAQWHATPVPIGYHIHVTPLP